VLVGAVVLSVAYGGLGPGIVTLALAWVGALWLLEPPRGELAIEDGSEWVRWGAALAIAAFLLAFMVLLRRERERATTAVEAAEDTIRDTSALQDLAAACSASLTRVEVARALVERLPGLLGARAGAMAMIDGPDLVVVDPESAAVQTPIVPRLASLTARAPIARAAASGDRSSCDRASLEQSHPDAIVFTPYARAAVAVPLRDRREGGRLDQCLYDDEADDRGRGSGRPDRGGPRWAGSRARGLYEVESESRRALDRILRMSPHSTRTARRR
jgi:hypothetical protein